MAIRSGGGAALGPVSAAVANKDLYEIGEIPPLGHVPASMYAWVVRKERHGPPEQLAGDPEVRRVYLGESFSLV